MKNTATQVEAWAVAHQFEIVPGVTVATSVPKLASGTGSVEAPLSDIKEAKETTLAITRTTAGNYTIKGTNTGGSDESTTAGINYDSTKGGLTK